MSEKLDKLFNKLKEGHMISLYGNRVMFYKEGSGEIQFWRLKDDEATGNLILYNEGVKISFDSYEIIENENHHFNQLILSSNERPVAYFDFPSEKRIIQNHNSFFVEEFALKMEDILNLSEKGDWADISELKVLVEGIKNNLSKIKSTQAKEIVAKSCIDIANYANMIYWLYGQE